jgi:signal transduction histidine kinase
VACRFSHQGVPLLKGAKAIAAYRVAQEALTNVARHAAARRVEVSLSAARGWLTLLISDDGQGFDPAHMAGQEGWGLAGMRERAGLAGGHLTITSAPGRGTGVKLTLPLTDEEKEGA